MFLYLLTCFPSHGSLLCRSQAVSKIHVPIYPHLISEGRRNWTSLWPAEQRDNDSRATCYQIQIHAKMNGWIFSENLKIVAIKLLELTHSHHQIYRFALILYCVWVRCDVDILKRTTRAQSIYRKVYGTSYMARHYKAMPRIPRHGIPCQYSRHGTLLLA